MAGASGRPAHQRAGRRGATLFVLYAAATEDTSPTRVASYVVSGIGFLGGGVILREGVNVRGLNTAATLWCSAAVGVLAASGHLVFTAIATGTVIAIHLVGRPLGRLIDRDNYDAKKTKACSPTWCRWCAGPKREKYARAQIVAIRRQQRHRAARNPLGAGRRRRDHLDGARAHGRPHAAARLESLVAELSLQTGIHGVQWYAGDEAQ